MKEKIQQIDQEVEQLTATSAEEAENLRIRFLGKKGLVTALFDEFKTVGPEEKRTYGKVLNELKNKVQDRIQALKDQHGKSTRKHDVIDDPTLPASPYLTGSRHPISIIRKEIIDIFSRIGFTVADGPEIEDDFHNFTALNFPEEHPARDMQDTFFMTTGVNPMALRTHTSSVQIRVLEKTQPPVRILMPGRVYRNEAISARAHCFFHQVEGLYVDKNVSFADMKQTLLFFAREMFGEKTQIRLRPSYFPFTEPSAEMDVSCPFCKGSGCNICKGSGWVEILGCGMVDPAVLENCNIDPEVYTGFAFGMGIERITMLRYQVNDLRLFSENDVRFLKQFSRIP